MQKPRKILYVITKSNYGGSQRYVFELATAMQAAGHSVAVASSPSGLLVNKLKANDITHFPIHSFQRDIKASKEIGATKELRECYRNFNPDIVHLNSSKAGVLGSLAARLEKVPLVIFTAHGWPFLEKRSLTWKAMAWTGSYLTALLSHKVILVSEDGRNKTNMPLVKNKLAVVKNAVPPIDFIEKNEARNKLFAAEEIVRHENDIWLVTAAELNQNKNISTAIRAVAEFNDKNEQKIFYSVIGDGEDREELEKLVARWKAEEQISFLGYVDQTRKYLKAFDVFLLPSIKEGMPYAILEAGAAGLATIGSKTGGIPEVIIDEQTGLLFNPASKSSLVKAIETYTAKPNLRSEHGQALSEKIQSDFSLTKMIEETRNIYKA